MWPLWALLAALALIVSGVVTSFPPTTPVLGMRPLPCGPTQQQRVFSAAEELEAVVDKYGEEAERFCQWYRREEGVAPSAELVLKICEQMKERGGAP